ncbi:cytochrome c oxidase assembly protein [Frondihabitans australicus]|uniref:Putative copper resistance protein D n=1 Tax=Frondihabitans australicus TaxID=386892 RepID=A0A495IEL4_9MICO|nr:cytochrome c oxidase assembly protein [Frondihabitans australicus]RKR74427.1 putative copper resistance protein D [Frondihabitans australicus]
MTAQAAATAMGASATGMSGDMWMPQTRPTVARLFALHLQPVPILPAFALALLVGYLVGVAALRRRGDRWPLGRTLLWTAGVVTVLVMTATGFDGYGMELFSVHMLQHMVVNMLSPILLTLGAPVTLLLRALPARPRGRRSARRLLLAVLHSRAVAVVTHPAVTLALFLGSLYGLYFTPLFDDLMRTMWGHNLMLVHFLAVGMLYFWGVVGVDPSPSRGRAALPVSRPVLRIIELAVTVPFHAFFGVVVMMSTTLIVGFYRHGVPGWGIDPLHDQQTGGGIAWGFTEIPTLIVLGVLFAGWQAQDARHTRRADRRAALTGDRDLADYNAYLARLSRTDPPPVPREPRP